MDAATGAVAWSVNVREKFNGKGFGFGYAASPLVEDDRLIVPAGRAVGKSGRLAYRRRSHALDRRLRSGQLLFGHGDHVRGQSLCGRLPGKRFGHS